MFRGGLLLALLGLVVSVGALPRPEQGLNYSEPARTWDEGLPLGNGLLGALVWGDGAPLRISINRTDLWDLRPVPEWDSPDYRYRTLVEWVKAGRLDDIVRLYDRPYEVHAGPTKIPAGRIELPLSGAFRTSRLDLRDGVATFETADSRATVIVHATENVGLMRVEGRAPTGPPTLVVPKFGGTPQKAEPAGMWELELAHLGYPEPLRQSGPGWVGYRQDGWGGFRFAVCAAWQERADGWEMAWAVTTSRDRDPLPEARSRAQRALRSGFGPLQPANRQWWDAYWSRASVDLPNEPLETLWYQEMYKFGAATRRDTPPINLQGPWTADTDGIPPWKGDYHHDLNTQLSYWPAYAGNQLDAGQGFVDWLWATRDNVKAWTQRFYERPGLNVPMTADLNNNQMGGWHPYTHSCTTAAWLAHHFYLQWRYSMDRAFLRDRAYPWFREAAQFLEAVSERGPDGLRYLPLSSSPEINDNRLDAYFTGNTNYDRALVAFVYEKAAELATELGLDADANRWRALRRETPPQVRGDDGRLYVAPDKPLAGSHRHFSHLMAIHPLGLIDRDNGFADRRTIRASLADLDRQGSDWWTGYSFAWLASLRARNGDGAGAEKALMDFTHFCLRNSFHVNGDQSGKGLSKFTYRPFTLEGNFAAASGVMEMLLQSHGGRVRVFPAVPEGWADVSFRTLRAEGAFLVSAERRGGALRRVEVVSESGGPLRLVTPFAGDPKASHPFRTEGDARVFDTAPGDRIVIEAG